MWLWGSPIVIQGLRVGVTHGVTRAVRGRSQAALSANNATPPPYTQPLNMDPPPLEMKLFMLTLW